VENGLIEPVRQNERKRWLEENREALDDYNRRIQKHGVVSDDLRRF
jgi:antitoxin CcdA